MPAGETRSSCQNSLMRQPRAPRVARGSVAASVATFAALMSHVSAGGAIPGWVGVAVPWILSVMVCTVLAGRKLSALKLTVAVVASQLLFHALFVLGTVPTGADAVMPGAHSHAVMTLTPVSGATAPMMHAGPTMWFMHGIAAVLTVAALYRGERVVQDLRALAAEWTAWVRRRFVRGLPLPFLFPFARVATDTSPGWHVAAAPQLTLLRRRGPPFALVL